tara:strand:+ start:788 stop:2467 length:1680 start_codon:yes stop_codon:yes gene_type:complete
MDQFKVSALKYRPNEFEDVIGQKSITDTLEKSIKTNQLAQALLFCGPRGVGKTTCARILSKKINSDTNSANDFSYNIFELDAASNNSVEDIRRLNDQVRIPPQSGQYKVYIIDEAHMLSTSAFNAFLKTLEEPPKYVIFILATTEKNKILPTILSRCQIFEFKRISLLDIKNYLIKISKENQVKYEENALQIIAEKADGALRDALSIYDQMCSFCELNLTEISVSKNLNLLSRSVYIEITNKIIDKNIPEILIKLDEIIKNGFDPHELIIGLSSHFRNLLISKDQETTKLIEVEEKTRIVLINQSSKFNYEVLIKSLDLANECELKYKNSNNKRLLVELTLMKISSLHFNGEKKKLIPITNYKNYKLPKKEIENEPKTRISSNIKHNSQSDIDENPSKKKEFIKNPSGISSFSLSSIKEKKNWENKKENTQSIKNEKKEEFSEKDLLDIWNQYYILKKMNMQQNIASILKINNPKLKENNSIEFEVPSEINKVELEKELFEILDFLKLKLNNSMIKIKIIVNELNQKKSFIYTDEEKFKKFVETNSSISKLKEEFGLEL